MWSSRLNLPFLLAAGLLFSGCRSSTQLSATASSSLLPATTTEQKVEALRRYRACLVARARSVDDYKSDAMTIAMSMRGSCRPELAEMAKATAGGAGIEAYNQIAESAVRREVDAALNAVLTERKERRPTRRSAWPTHQARNASARGSVGRHSSQTEARLCKLTKTVRTRHAP